MCNNHLSNVLSLRDHFCFLIKTFVTLNCSQKVWLIITTWIFYSSQKVWLLKDKRRWIALERKCSLVHAHLWMNLSPRYTFRFLHESKKSEWWLYKATMQDRVHNYLDAKIHHWLIRNIVTSQRSWICITRTSYENSITRTIHR